MLVKRIGEYEPRADGRVVSAHNLQVHRLPRCIEENQGSGASFVMEELATHELGHSSRDGRTCYTTKSLYDGRKERWNE